MRVQLGAWCAVFSVVFLRCVPVRQTGARGSLICRTGARGSRDIELSFARSERALFGAEKFSEKFLPPSELQILETTPSTFSAADLISMQQVGMQGIQVGTC